MARKNIIEWNKVTSYSKISAVLVFGVTFWLGLQLGLSYQQTLDEPLYQSIMLTSTHRSSTGGNIVGEGAHCGGFIKNAPVCGSGLRCQLSINPDLGGQCVKD